MLVVFVIVFSDSDRVGRGEWSRVYDACMVVRVYLSGPRAPCMPRRCLRRLETRHPYHLGGVFWYGSSISIIIYLSLIRGISSVADGENVCFKLALKQGFSALVTVISLIYSAVCVAGSCLDLQQPAVESRILLLWQFLAFPPNPRSVCSVVGARSYVC